MENKGSMKRQGLSGAGVGLISFNSETQTTANRAKFYTRNLVYMFSINFVLKLHTNQG